MLALIGAVVAGLLTVLAPCVLPVLPLIAGGTVGSRWRPYVIAASLAGSVVIFTLALKATTALIMVPPQFWRGVSAALLVALGLVSVFPTVWDKAMVAVGFQARSAERLHEASGREGVWGAVLTGAALGPVFTSCSPLYGYVIVTVIPARPAYGVVLLLGYALGLAVALLAIALAGRRLIAKLGWAADPHGAFRKVLGLLLVALGVAIWMGWDQDLQTWILINSPIRPWELDQGFIPEG